MTLTMRERIGCYALIGAFAIFLLAPVVWMAAAAFKDQLATFQSPPILIARPTTANFAQVLSDNRFMHSLLNSLIVSVATVAVTMVLATPTAYGLSRIRSRGKSVVLSWVLLVRAAPGMIYIIPYFLVFSGTGLMDTRLGLVIVSTIFTVPLAIWMLLAFFDAVPREVEESSFMDGATKLQTLLFVALPIAAPGVASTAILVFIFSWNEFLFALTLTRVDARTAAVAILNYLAYEGTEWGKVAAAAMLILSPVLVFASVIRKYLVQTTAGAVK